MKKKFNKVLFGMALLLSSYGTYAQNVGVNTATPDASAALDVVATNRGVLVPRLALSATNNNAPVTAPATSLLVYNTATVADVTPGFYYWDGAQWIRLSTSSGTDDQNLTSAVLAGNTLTIDIENGNPVSVDLSALQDGTGTDDQNLTSAVLAGTTLTLGIENGNPVSVNLSALQDGTGTDDQNLTSAVLAGNTLTIDIENGNPVSVDLSALQDGTGTDDQNLTSATLVGTTLTLGIENGNPVSINLAALVNDADNVVGNEYNTGASLAGTVLSITDPGGNQNVDLASLRRNAENGLYVNGGNNAIRLGGPLIENTTITQGAFSMFYNLNGGGDFHIQDNGVNHFSVVDNGDSYFGSDVYWRDNSTAGTILARLIDSGDDGLFDIYRNGGVQHRLHGNGTSVFNEQSGNFDFRVESDGNANMLFVDGGTNAVGIGTGTPLNTLHVQGTERVTSLAGAGNRMVIADANGVLGVQAIPANGDITGVTAGVGLTGGGNTGTVTLNAAADNGLYLNAGADRIRLGGTLVENTTITNGTFPLTINLDNTGDFLVQDAGVTHFEVRDNGITYFGDNSQWRDNSTAGTIFAQIYDDADDGAMVLYENGGNQIILDANTGSVFNEQGLNRDFRVESDGNTGMMFVDASTNRVGIGTTTPDDVLDVNGDIVLTGGVRNIEIQAGDRNISLDDANPVWNGDTYGAVTRFYGDNNLAGSKLEAGGLELQRRLQIRGGNPAVGRVLTSVDANGTAIWQNETGDVAAVTAGTGLTGGGTTGNLTINAVAVNGLRTTANDIRLGGTLIENTTITQGVYSMIYNLNNTGDFLIRDNGVNRFAVLDNGRTTVGGTANAGRFNVTGNSYFSDDLYLRDGAVNGGDILVRIYDSVDDGIIDVYEDNGINHRIHGNGTTVFNEQGNNNADVRMESDTRTNMFWLDANENLVRFGTNSTFSDNGNGTTVGGTVVDYVADFDRGIGATGTAIGIGSVEYLLDNSSETTINNAFSPTTHINRDLGFSTATRGWDDVYADNFVNISDEREKKDIKELSYGLSEVLKMRPVSYILKKDPFGDRKLGLIAQEALVLVPEAVKTHDNKILDEAKPEEYTRIELERMGMTYQQLIPVLIKATQEQQAQIEELKKEIAILKAEKK